MEIIIGIVFGALMGMGLGGGGLLVIYLALTTDIVQSVAQGVNLYFFIFASAASLPVHFSRRNLDFKTIGIISSCGACGSILGSYLSSVTPDAAVRRIFGIMLIISGLIVFVKSGIRIIKEKGNILQIKNVKNK